MSSIRRSARVLAFAGGAILVGLSVAGFNSPVVLPTPALPAPLPSVPAPLNLLGPSGSSQPSTGSSPASRQSPAGAVQRPSSLATTGAPPAGSIHDSIAPASRGARDLTAAEPAALGHLGTGLPGTGGPSGGGGAPLPLLPAVPAALLLGLLFFGLRMTSRPVTARRYRIRVGFNAAGAPAAAAALAVRRLLESELPAETRIRPDGDFAFWVEAPILLRGTLSARLPEAAARARRVGLRLDLNAEPARQPSPAPASQPRLALG